MDEEAPVDMKDQDKDVECDEDGNPILPKGTVMVLPEAVNDSSSLYWPEFAKIYKKMKVEGNVADMIITCTSCSCQVNHKMTGTVFAHPLLEVLLCKKCTNFYNSGGFTKDENGIDEYCRWCAEGGELLVCDSCPHAFCKACIRRNFGRSELTKISQADEWKCLICDPSPLLELRALCRLVLNYNKKESKRKSDRGSAHTRNLFTSPSVKMDRRMALEICMDNAVHAGRFLREGIAVLRKKLGAADDPNVYAERVGNKLKKFLQVTKDNLDSVARAVDRELAKELPARDVASEPKPSTSTRPLRSGGTAETDKKAEERSVSDVKKTKPRIVKKDTAVKEELIEESGVEEMALTMDEEFLDECSGLVKSEVRVKNLGLALPEEDEVPSGKSQECTPDKENPKATSTPETGKTVDKFDGKVANTESFLDQIEESESLENITPDEVESTNQLQEEEGTAVENSEAENDSEVEEDDPTQPLFEISPLKNNDDNNQMKGRRSKKADQVDFNDSPSKLLKLVLKKLPRTNDLDREVITKDKEARKTKERQKKENGEQSKSKLDVKNVKGKLRTSSRHAKKTAEEKESSDETVNASEDVLNEEATSKAEIADAEAKEKSSDGDSDSTVLAENDETGTTKPDQTHVATKVKEVPVVFDDSDVETLPDNFSHDLERVLLGESEPEEVTNEPKDKDSMPKTKSSTEIMGADLQVVNDDASADGDNEDALDELISTKDIVLQDIAAAGCDEEDVVRDVAVAVSDEEDVVEDVHDGEKIIDDKSDAEKDATSVDGERAVSSSQNVDQLEQPTDDGTDGKPTSLVFSDISEDDPEVAPKDVPENSGTKSRSKLRTESLDDAPTGASTVELESGDENKMAKQQLLNLLKDDSDEDAGKEAGNASKASRKNSKEEKKGNTRTRQSASSRRDAIAKKALLICLQSDSDEDAAKARPDSTPGPASSKTAKAANSKASVQFPVVSSGSSISSDEDDPLAPPKSSKQLTGRDIPGPKSSKKVTEIVDMGKFIAEDPKLKLDTLVALDSLPDNFNEELAESGIVVVPRNRSNSLTEEEAIDRDIARMGNLKSLHLKKKRKRSQNGDDESGQNDSKDEMEEKSAKTPKEKKSIPAKKIAKKEILLFSSSSEDEVELLDSDEEKSKKTTNDFRNELQQETKSMNEKAKDMLSELLRSSDENSDLNENSEEKSKKKGKGKDGKKGDSADESKSTNSDDDSDDFIPVKKGKGRFNSKLLRAKLSDDSDESYKASSDSRKKKKRGGARSKGSDASGATSSDNSSSDVSIVKRKRRTRGGAKSGSNSDDSNSNAKKKKKRRRIKTMSGSSDSDGKGVDENDKSQTPSGKSRKNIRRLLGDAKLREDTKNAAKEEAERRDRVLALQKQYNVVISDTGKDGAPITKKLALAKDPKSGKTLLEVHPDLICQLKPHQVDGVKFLWEATCESLERLQTHHGSGCILAHCMGLGKTLQVIAYLHTLMSHKRSGVRNALVVCPLNTVVNWYLEFRNWLDEIDPPLEVTELSSVKSNYERARVMKNWMKDGGILILGYEMFRTLTQEKSKRIKKMCRETFQKALINPGPDIVVCDEGHLLKNSATSLSKAMSRISTRRRVVLTGTPLQNNLSEYHCMVDFVKPNLLGTMKEFKNRFVNPIQNGQCADSTAQDVKIMKRRAHILHNLLAGCVQRRDYNVLTPFLPQKHEYVISIRLTDIQAKLYVHYLENMARKFGKNSLFADYQQLMRIWTHPWVIRLAEIRQENKPPTYSDDSFIDDDSEQSENEDDGVVVLDDDDDEPSTSKGRKKGDGSSDEEVVNNWKSRSRSGKPKGIEEQKIDSPLPQQCTNWWTEFINEEEAQKFEHSGKLILLFSILRECYNIGDKLLLFSQSLLSLDLIETMLGESREKNEDGTDNEHYAGRWIQGQDYFRLDGSTSAELRSRYTKSFNDEENFTARLFLISTRAGSLGINLVAANRVIVFDASWNPSHDVQSIFRVYRFGQEKPVYVYRFLAQGTMEEKIYDRQVTKQSLACRVVDEQQIERHFNWADLQELYSYTPDRVNKRPTPMLPKDRLLAELLIKKKDLIINYHEHDSLLVNQEAEELDEEERKGAWLEYEVERQGMLDENGQQVILQGPYGARMDVGSIIQAIQQKQPGLSIDQLKEKLRATLSAMHKARMQAMEQQRNEIIKQQMLFAAQQRELSQKNLLASLQNTRGDMTPAQAAWVAQVLASNNRLPNNNIHNAPNTYVSLPKATPPEVDLTFGAPSDTVLNTANENLKKAISK